MKIDPTGFGGHDHLVSVVQCQGIRNKYGYTITTTVSSWKVIEKKRKYQKSKLDRDQYILTRKDASNKALVTKSPSVNGDVLQPGGALARRLNNEKPHRKNTVTDSGVDCKLC